MSVYLFVTIFLPSGSFLGFNFKAPLYFGLLPLAAYSASRRRRAAPAQLALLLGAPAVLSIWILIGLCNGFAAVGSLRQYTDIVLTLLLCWLVLVFCGDQEFRRVRFLSFVVNAEIATCLLKIALIAYALFRGIPVVEITLLMSKAFGVDLMTMDLGAMFGRVQFFSDALIPICIFIVLRHRGRMHIGNLRATIMILLLLVSVIFSFSRYFWAFSVLAFLLGLVLGKRDRFQAVLLAGLGITIIASLPLLAVLYQLRFSQSVAGDSDLIRTEQIHALREFFLDAPLIGHGLGSYTNQVLRAQATEAGRYGYEVQLLALAGQIGILGTTLLFLLVAYCYRALWWKSILAASDRIGIGLLLCSWLAAGLYNPLLFHPIAGVIYASLSALAAIPSKNNRYLLQE